MDCHLFGRWPLLNNRDPKDLSNGQPGILNCHRFHANARSRLWDFFVSPDLSSTGHRCFHLKQASPGYDSRILLPLMGIEQFQRERSLETNLRQSLQDLVQWSNTVTRINPVGIRETGLRGDGWIVIDMEYVHRGPI